MKIRIYLALLTTMLSSWHAYPNPGKQSIISPEAAPPQIGECHPTPHHYAVRIVPHDEHGRVLNEFPYVAGDRNFYQRLDNGWLFSLQRIENGWALRLYDHESIGDSIDLTSLTPPLRGAPNPRDIVGWHFRNPENTAPNAGDVNAPQRLRTFIISPELQGTGGFRPSGGEQVAGPDSGLGWLRIVDFGLANPVPGQRARMNYLSFDACLTWPRPHDETLSLLDRASLTYLDEERELFGKCGLDLQRYELAARYLPRTLGGDLDGDGSLDEVVQIRRRSDDQHGVAICRAGTWLHLLGFESRATGKVRAGYEGQVEAWQWVAAGERTTDGLPRHLTGFTLPDAAGDILLLERIEKEAVLVYWQAGQLHKTQLYHYVEP